MNERDFCVTLGEVPAVRRESKTEKSVTKTKNVKKNDAR